MKFFYIAFVVFFLSFNFNLESNPNEITTNQQLADKYEGMEWDKENTEFLVYGKAYKNFAKAREVWKAEKARIAEEAEKVEGYFAEILAMKEKLESTTQTQGKSYDFLFNVILLISILLNYILINKNNKNRKEAIYLSKLLKEIEKFTQKFSTIEKTKKESSFEKDSETLSDDSNYYEKILDSFSTLKENLDERDRKIKMHESGYDLQIIKRYVKKLIRMDQICIAVKKDPKMTEETKYEINFLHDEISKTLKDAEVKKYSLSKGVSTKSEEFGIPPKEEWKITKTTNEENDHTIKKTIKEGFYFDGEKKKIIEYAYIEVYIKGEENE